MSEVQSLMALGEATRRLMVLFQAPLPPERAEHLQQALPVLASLVSGAAWVAEQVWLSKRPMADVLAGDEDLIERAAQAVADALAAPEALGQIRGALQQELAP